MPPAAQSTRVTPAMRQAMFDNGMVIVDDAVEPDMLVRLRAAARHCVAEAHAHPDERHLHGGNMIRDRPGDGPSALRGVMMPGWGCPEFAEYLGSEPVLDYVRG